MEHDTSVRKLVELIFSKQFENAEKMTAPDSSIPTCFLTNDFPRKLEDVLHMNLVICLSEWGNHIKTYGNIMFSSPRAYLHCTIIACLTEATYHENVFEIFVSVCALLRFFNYSILDSIGKDFSYLNTDVFMVVYDNILKSKFCEKGGFQQFAEFIHGHRYLSWKRKVIASTDAAARDAILKNFKVERESNRCIRITEDVLKTIEANSIILAQKVLSTTSAKFPTLSNNPDWIKGLKVSGSEEKEEKNEKEKIMKATTEFLDSDVTSQGCSSSNSDSRRHHTINLPENMPLLGKTIETVHAHYHARFSGNANLDNRIQKADESM